MDPQQRTSRECIHTSVVVCVPAVTPQSRGIACPRSFRHSLAGTAHGCESKMAVGKRPSILYIHWRPARYMHTYAISMPSLVVSDAHCSAQRVGGRAHPLRVHSTLQWWPPRRARRERPGQPRAARALPLRGRRCQWMLLGSLLLVGRADPVGPGAAVRRQPMCRQSPNRSRHP